MKGQHYCRVHELSLVERVPIAQELMSNCIKIQTSINRGCVECVITGVYSI